MNVTSQNVSIAVFVIVLVASGEKKNYYNLQNHII